MAVPLRGSEGPTTRKRNVNDAAKSFLDSAGQRYRSSYTGATGYGYGYGQHIAISNTDYRSNSNPDLMHQALLPPSRFADNVSSMSASSFHQDHYETRKSKSIPNRIVSNATFLSSFSIPIAVLLWYLLGVMSIGSTKVLLRDYESAGMSPLILTVQQLFIGYLFLRLWIYVKNGVRPHPIPYKNVIQSAFSNDKNSTNPGYIGYDKLILTAAFFTSGFWLTNISFSCSDASFVETIKASEPITSAALASMWGLEHVGSKEVLSLLMICIGLVMSTFGNVHGGDEAQSSNVAAATTLMQSIISCGIIMGSNLSFSFRGLYQKIFRSSPNGNRAILDDLNLQYRIHQVGLCIMVLPLILYEAPRLSRVIIAGISSRGGGMWNFLCLSIINGFAFTHYK